MADEFVSGICSGNLWNSAERNMGFKSLPYSTPSIDIHGGNFYGWSTTTTTSTTNDISEMKTTRSSDESTTTATSLSGNSSINVYNQETDSVGDGGTRNNTFMDSTLQMMGFDLSSSSPTSLDWNQNFISNNDLQGNRRLHDQVMKDWSSKNHSASFGLDQNSCSSEGLMTSFAMDSALYGYPNSTLLQGLFESDHRQPQQSTNDNQNLNYPPSLTNYFMNNNDFSSNTTCTSSLPKQQQASTPFWSASAAAMDNGPSSFFPSQQAQFLQSTLEDKPNCNTLVPKRKVEGVRDSNSMAKKNISEPTFKRPRIETPSPLPTFKVRKEKLGDRITALQQLVSPFGKTDTASVLFEAIEYIKFLHEQVSVLSTPYLKNGVHMQHNHQISNKIKEAQGKEKDLRSLGLCLVPLSNIFPITNEAATDFWTPTFGGSYR